MANSQFPRLAFQRLEDRMVLSGWTDHLGELNLPAAEAAAHAEAHLPAVFELDLQSQAKSHSPQKSSISQKRVEKPIDEAAQTARDLVILDLANEQTSQPQFDLENQGQVISGLLTHVADFVRPVHPGIAAKVMSFAEKFATNEPEQTTPVAVAAESSQPLGHAPANPGPSPSIPQIPLSEPEPKISSSVAVAAPVVTVQAEVATNTSPSESPSRRSAKTDSGSVEPVQETMIAHLGNATRDSAEDDTDGKEREQSATEPQSNAGASGARIETSNTAVNAVDVLAWISAENAGLDWVHGEFSGPLSESAVHEAATPKTKQLTAPVEGDLPEQTADSRQTNGVPSTEFSREEFTSESQADRDDTVDVFIHFLGMNEDVAAALASQFQIALDNLLPQSGDLFANLLPFHLAEIEAAIQQHLTALAEKLREPLTADVLTWAGATVATAVIVREMVRRQKKSANKDWHWDPILGWVQFPAT